MERGVGGGERPPAAFPRAASATAARMLAGPAPRGAASHFVGSTLVIMAGFTVTTLAMNLGRSLKERKPDAS